MRFNEAATESFKAGTIVSFAKNFSMPSKNVFASSFVAKAKMNNDSLGLLVFFLMIISTHILLSFYCENYGNFEPDIGSILPFPISAISTTMYTWVIGTEIFTDETQIYTKTATAQAADLP